MRERRKNWRIIHYPNNDQCCYPRYWHDELCTQILLHATSLLVHGNPMRFSWCCGLDRAVATLDYEHIRWWISMHEKVIRRVLCYDLEYDTPEDYSTIADLSAIRLTLKERTTEQ